MANEILNSLLKEYDQKKLRAEVQANQRKLELYILIPRLKEIDSELDSIGINMAKNIINGSSQKLDINSINQKKEDLKKEREEILHKNGYSDGYLKPQYECKICNDTGYVTDSNYNTRMCSCLKQKLLHDSFNKSNISNINKENFDNFNELLFSDKVDKERYKLDISPRENIINIKNKSIEFVNNFDNPDYKNLLFSGSTGLRKKFYVKLYCC